MADPRHRLGRRGERAAAMYLEQEGWRVLARNWACRRGEIDLIVRRRDTIAFVEVRTHARPDGEVPPQATVTQRKQARILATARTWIGLQAAETDCVFRFDIIGVVLAPQGTTARITHLPNAFTP